MFNDNASEVLYSVVSSFEQKKKNNNVSLKIVFRGKKLCVEGFVILTGI